MAALGIPAVCPAEGRTVLLARATVGQLQGKANPRELRLGISRARQVVGNGYLSVALIHGNLDSIFNSNIWCYSGELLG